MKKMIMGIAATALMANLAFAQAPATSTGAADNSNSKSNPPMSVWMSEHSKANKGYISRKAYMDEMGRRWDMTWRSSTRG
jgi:hypothetical protein